MTTEEMGRQIVDDIRHHGDASFVDLHSTGRRTRRHLARLTLMTLADHGAAAGELAEAHRRVTRFETIARGKRKMPGRVLTLVKRIHRVVRKLRLEMREVQARTLGDSAAASTCWRHSGGPPHPATGTPSEADVGRRRPVMALDEHIEAARALGAAKAAVRRFSDLLGDRKKLPVRTIDMGLQIDDLIQRIRVEMDDLQFVTLRGRERCVDCWLGHFNYFDGDEDGASDRRPKSKPATRSQMSTRLQLTH